MPQSSSQTAVLCTSGVVAIDITHINVRHISCENVRTPFCKSRTDCKSEDTFASALRQSSHVSFASRHILLCMHLMGPWTSLPYKMLFGAFDNSKREQKLLYCQVACMCFTAFLTRLDLCMQSLYSGWPWTASRHAAVRHVLGMFALAKGTCHALYTLCDSQTVITVLDYRPTTPWWCQPVLSVQRDPPRDQIT